MKYKLTDETKVWLGIILHRIQYENGEMGGWIEKEWNLDQSGDARVFDNAQVSGDAKIFGDAWVFDNARIFGDAQVFGDARVLGDARVFSDADWMIVGPIGSRDGITTIFREKKNKIAVSCGCFLGSLDEFEKQVDETHGNNAHGKAYRAMIEMAKIRFQIMEDGNEHS